MSDPLASLPTDPACYGIRDIARLRDTADRYARTAADLLAQRNQTAADLERLRAAVEFCAAGYDQIDGGTEQVKVYAADVAAKIRAAAAPSLGSPPARAHGLDINDIRHRAHLCAAYRHHWAGELGQDQEAIDWRRRAKELITDSIPALCDEIERLRAQDVCKCPPELCRCHAAEPASVAVQTPARPAEGHRDGDTATGAHKAAEAVNAAIVGAAEAWRDWYVRSLVRMQHLDTTEQALIDAIAQGRCGQCGACVKCRWDKPFAEQAEG